MQKQICWYSIQLKFLYQCNCMANGLGRHSTFLWSSDDTSLNMTHKCSEGLPILPPCGSEQPSWGCSEVIALVWQRASSALRSTSPSSNARQFLGKKVWQLPWGMPQLINPYEINPFTRLAGKWDVLCKLLNTNAGKKRPYI